MIFITGIFAKLRKENTKDAFLVANRKLGWFNGGISIAASWIWAPALFISSQIAYQKGLAGIFWFTLPNIIALAIFAFLAPKIRSLMPKGYTLPQFIKEKFKSKRTHIMYIIPYMFYQIMAVTVQLFAGGHLVSLLTGIPFMKVLFALAIIALIYTLISGLAASVITDVLQLALIFIIGIIIIPMTLTTATGGFNLQGIENIGNIFDPGVAFSFGIVTSIGLIAGAISDQQYWQRTFALKKKKIIAAFIFGALLFGIVPIALSSLGFLAANPSLGISLPEGLDVSMIGVQTVAQLLPSWAVMLFVIMLLAGLTSTLDSGLAAGSSLWIIDIMNKKKVKYARWGMIIIMLISVVIALAVEHIPEFGLQHLWWIFNTIAACILVPTLASLYKKHLSEKGVFWGILFSFIVGVPLFIYGNIVNSAHILVSASLFIIGINMLFCSKNK